MVQTAICVIYRDLFWFTNTFKIKPAKWINKQTNKYTMSICFSWKKVTLTDIVWMMAHNKVNKTHHSAGRLCASIWLKCKNKCTIKKVLFFNQSWTFPPKFFRANSIPYMAIKWSTKILKGQSTLRTLIRENHYASHLRQIKDRWRSKTNPHHRQPSPDISNIRLRPVIAYKPMSHHRENKPPTQ